MPIQEGDFIRLHFTGYANGILFDTTDEQKAREAGVYEEGRDYTPKVVCVGKRQIILGLDEAIIGKEPGFEETIQVPPEKAFGEHEQELLRSYEKKSFNKKPERGMVVNIPEAGRGTVVNIIGNRVIVDFNHPLAGQTLTYTYRIEGIVESATEKIAGLIKLFSGYDMDVSLEGSTALIQLPPGIYYVSNTWFNMKPYIMKSIFDQVSGIEEVRFIETYKNTKNKSEE
ncbi:FKBP-type peptidyl-prolyl cis-trans isomerase [Methanospirillum sp.]|uniref:peptidylprolyl isomerase n=2 Tax=Methanospirillum sp. TaxID=45200 RepID=UPI002C187F02|nr:FKBP-type peptidyl-prolyl cis-trans isomerase [Methanospirillum sp.]HOL40633.1 FKBP-type peptidyl-prolyl cis-trans isomerase [Methanospirillum sp.]HPP78004.1 FKBP-type peptidyl-prolyl cis-trans isomerase [Methanospirillum sp.]